MEMKFDICGSCEVKSPAARRLKTTELAQLGQNCAKALFQKGDVIFKQGALSSNIIYIKEGLVKLHMNGPTHEQIIKISKPPCYLGMPTTFGDKINQYSATAIEETTACFISIETFREFIHMNGDFAYEITLELCRNEVNTFSRCVNRTQKNLHGRIADALLFFSDSIYAGPEFTLPLSRSEFGDFVDASRENVSRILSAFHADGLIEIKGKRIRILDAGLLGAVSRNG